MSGRHSLFIYDAEAFSGGAAGWLHALRPRKAEVRGQLFRSPRGRFGLIPVAEGALIRGRLVELTEPQLAVLDFIVGAGAGFARAPIQAVVNLRTEPAQTWVLRDPAGWRPLGTDRGRG